MEFDLPWLLLALPASFALGWAASRLDLRQWRRESSRAPKAYFNGLNLLLNEQQDKAIDAFIEAVQHDPDTAELHFALGNLFRRRGEFERAVRVHEHLLSRADLKAVDRDRAQQALAQDFMKAGLFDRAEAAWQSLQGTHFDGQAREALLSLAERSRDWPRALQLAQGLEAKAPGRQNNRLAHYECELALEAQAAGRSQEAQAALARAQVAAPQAARPWLLAGQLAHQAGQAHSAHAAWQHLLERQEPKYWLVAAEHARAVLGLDQPAAVQQLREQLHRWQALMPALELQEALAVLQAPSGCATSGWAEQLTRHPSLSAAQRLLGSAQGPLDQAQLTALKSAVDAAARPLQRYRCAACGFEAQHYFWHCPGCLSWESFPPQRLDELT